MEVKTMFCLTQHHKCLATIFKVKVGRRDWVPQKSGLPMAPYMLKYSQMAWKYKIRDIDIHIHFFERIHKGSFGILTFSLPYINSRLQTPKREEGKREKQRDGKNLKTKQVQIIGVRKKDTRRGLRSYGRGSIICGWFEDNIWDFSL